MTRISDARLRDFTAFYDDTDKNVTLQALRDLCDDLCDARQALTDLRALLRDVGAVFSEMCPWLARRVAAALQDVEVPPEAATVLAGPVCVVRKDLP